ncbi:MAG TPA: glucokinase [Candidatus Tectomicrobia bacterium]|nr:glucokinase [Candidatus Tectomicrobia bacterium]
MILAGDIGGTNSRLAIFARRRGRLELIIEETFASREHADLETILKKFMASHELSVDVACFGIAGPITDGRSQAVNLPWVVDARHLTHALDIDTVVLLNDLEASAYGLAVLAADDFVRLNPGAPNVSGNAAVIAAGTGLGEAGLYWDGQQHHPFACEGGHSSFAPSDPLQMELLGFLLCEFEHVSWERVLSGPGLHNIYRFLRDTGRGEEPAWLKREMQQHDPAAVISQAALAGKSPLCGQALDLFVALYGAEAGNVALKFMATAGVYVGGGIAPKIIQKLTDSTFLRAFVAKGRLQALLQAVPVRIIMNDRASLLGAARFAMLKTA